jgi:hypothetical protein
VLILGLVRRRELRLYHLGQRQAIERRVLPGALAVGSRIHRRERHLLGKEPYLVIAESTEPQPINGWVEALAPAPGTLVTSPNGIMLARGHWSGLTVENGLYVTILASDRDVMLAAAQALEPFSR